MPVRVRVEGSSFRYDGERYTGGDTLDVSESVAERHPNTLIPVDSDDTPADNNSDDQDQGQDEAVPGIDFDEVDIDDGHESEPEQESGQGICGAEMVDGSLCERPAGECPYHD